MRYSLQLRLNKTSLRTLQTACPTYILKKRLSFLNRGFSGYRHNTKLCASGYIARVSELQFLVVVVYYLLPLYGEHRHPIYPFSLILQYTANSLVLAMSAGGWTKIIVVVVVLPSSLFRVNPSIDGAEQVVCDV